MTSILYSANNFNIICTVVYAFNEEEKRKPLWDYLVAQSKNVNLPWLVAGDFNSILYNNDRMNNGCYNFVGEHNFIDCITLSKLVEPNFSGNFFTWRGGNSFSIHSKIDRVFVNPIWLDKIDKFGICFGNHSLSDHAQILINLQMQNMTKRKIPFKYKNSWHSYDDYH
ncbi:endonuclease/exonuclease/phosphatase family protein, partial [Vibrio cholerae]|uniref:endonuclease/exonuclease/phosphatase family protein n=1 Tax=Vibrio cholerae TaxID=666 RepID=UPI003014CE3F